MTVLRERTPTLNARNTCEPTKEELAARIRRRIAGLAAFVANDPGIDEKEAVRRAYAGQWRERNDREAKALGPMLSDLVTKFAVGHEVRPDRIRPRLILARSGEQTGMLFRLATTLWSVPVSAGYGRRIRYLVEDATNGKIIGLFALGDPVAGVAARDRWIGWNAEQRRMRLSSVMDAYVCGAVPPYSFLLGGKVVVSMMGSKEVSEEFHRRYYDRPSEFSGAMKRPKLVLITVTSALGKSSLYNRVRLPGLVQLTRLGSRTLGWGHCHIPSHDFDDMKSLLDLYGHPYANGYKYGDGPNWRMRVIRKALELAGVDDDALRHGIQREVFAMPLSTMWQEYLTGKVNRCQVKRPSARTIGRAAVERWVLPRAERRPEWKHWSEADRSALFDPLLLSRPTLKL